MHPASSAVDALVTPSLRAVERGGRSRAVTVDDRARNGFAFTLRQTTQERATAEHLSRHARHAGTASVQALRIVPA
jgi:hypothetical protein